MPEIVFNLVDVYPYRRRGSGPVEFLLMRRAPGTRYEGEWRMVGGKIETGETSAQAAMREVKEETGLAPSSMWALPSANVFYDLATDCVRVAAPFAAELEGRVLLNHEHDDVAWLAADAAAERLRWPAQRRLLLLAHAELAHALPVSWRVPLDID